MAHHIPLIQTLFINCLKRIGEWCTLNVLSLLIGMGVIKKARKSEAEILCCKICFGCGASMSPNSMKPPSIIFSRSKTVVDVTQKCLCPCFEGRPLQPLLTIQTCTWMIICHNAHHYPSASDLTKLTHYGLC